MVGPMSDDDRNSLARRLKVGFVVLIGASAGLITSQGEATALEALLITVVGLAFGALVVWVVFPETGGTGRSGR